MICGDPQGEDTKEMLRCVHSVFSPNKVVKAAPSSSCPGDLPSSPAGDRGTAEPCVALLGQRGGRGRGAALVALLGQLHLHLGLSCSVRLAMGPKSQFL